MPQLEGPAADSVSSQEFFAGLPRDSLMTDFIFRSSMELADETFLLKVVLPRGTDEGSTSVEQLLQKDGPKSSEYDRDSACGQRWGGALSWRSLDSPTSLGGGAKDIDDGGLHQHRVGTDQSTTGHAYLRYETFYWKLFLLTDEFFGAGFQDHGPFSTVPTFPGLHAWAYSMDKSLNDDENRFAITLKGSCVHDLCGSLLKHPSSIASYVQRFDHVFEIQPTYLDYGCGLLHLDASFVVMPESNSLLDEYPQSLYGQNFEQFLCQIALAVGAEQTRKYQIRRPRARGFDPLQSVLSVACKIVWIAYVAFLRERMTFTRISIGFTVVMAASSKWRTSSTRVASRGADETSVPQCLSSFDSESSSEKFLSTVLNSFSYPSEQPSTGHSSSCCSIGSLALDELPSIS
nr:hypothetical protein Iba_chr02aCG22860 [Ipomoea batatas]